LAAREFTEEPRARWRLFSLAAASLIADGQPAVQHRGAAGL